MAEKNVKIAAENLKTHSVAGKNVKIGGENVKTHSVAAKNVKFKNSVIVLSSTNQDTLTREKVR